MKKTPLQRLGQLQAGLALVAVVAVGLGFAIPDTIRILLFVIAGIATTTLLISWAIGYAAEAIVEAIRERASVG